MRELDRLLPELAPPPGGLARLQTRMHARHNRRHPARWLPALAAGTALALLALTWLPGQLQQVRRSEALTQDLLQAVSPPPIANGIEIAHGAALPLPSGQADVRLYLVASTPTPTH